MPFSWVEGVGRARCNAGFPARIGLVETEYSGSWNYDVNYVNKETIKNTVGKYYPTQANSARFIYAPQVQEVEFTEPSETGRYFEYLTLDVWLSIVSAYFNVQSTSKKDWRGKSKTQIPGGKFVQVKKKCKKFPYCNQGDMGALKLTNEEKVNIIINRLSKKYNLTENVIKTILSEELKKFK